MSLLYQPPAGYYDTPMTWLWSPGLLANGIASLPNQQVSIRSGYGDFLLRRIVGLNNVLYPSNLGQFQIRDALGRYLQSVPQSIGGAGLVPPVPGQLATFAADIAVVPELLYPENSQIYFDLYNLQKALDYSGFSTNGAQIAFQGVRRLPGTSPFDATYRYRTKTYTYVRSLTLPVTTSGQSAPPKQILTLTVTDYDFELHELQFIYSINGVPIPNTLALAGIQLFNQNLVTIADGIKAQTSSGGTTDNQLISDYYINSLSYYGNGALVPPLLYAQNSKIQMAVESFVGATAVNMAINFVGKQRIPC